MQQEVLDFLGSQPVAVLALATPEGGVHGATLHAAFGVEPLTFYFGTGKGTKKGVALLASGSAEASVVIGFSEDEMKTFQSDGEVSVMEDAGAFDAVYLGRFPNKAERAAGENFLRLKFTPTWWRYTDMKNKTVVEG